MIRGFFDPDSPWPVPYVHAFLTLPGLTLGWSEIDFLLDTGAGGTSLHPVDAVRCGIPATDLIDVSKWPASEERYGVGGSARYYIVPARYAFEQADGDAIEIAAQISIAQPTADNIRLPSLLGWDLLQRFSVTTDWQDRRMELHQR